MQKDKTNNGDMAESANDRKHLQPDGAVLDLPDVKDIPGQEHIHVPDMREYADTTISSADEEGEGILDDEEEDDDDDLEGGNLVSDESDYDENSEDKVTPTERQMLEMAAEQTPGDEEAEDRRRMTLDNVDDDGVPLMEADLESDAEGEDLDLPEDEETTEEETPY